MVGAGLVRKLMTGGADTDLMRGASVGHNDGRW